MTYSFCCAGSHYTHKQSCKCNSIFILPNHHHFNPFFYFILSPLNSGDSHLGVKLLGRRPSVVPPFWVTKVGWSFGIIIPQRVILNLLIINVISYAIYPVYRPLVYHSSDLYEFSESRFEWIELYYKFI